MFFEEKEKKPKKFQLPENFFEEKEKQKTRTLAMFFEEKEKKFKESKKLLTFQRNFGLSVAVEQQGIKQRV